MAEEEKYTGKRGRKSAVRGEKRTRGRPANPRPQGKPGLVVDSFLPVAPDWLAEDAAAEWNRVGSYLLDTQRVSKLDFQLLATYCSSYAFFADAMRPLIIDRLPVWDYVKERPRPSVLVAVGAKHGNIVIDACRKFGMTARTRHLDHVEGAGRPATPKQIQEVRTGRKVTGLPSFAEDDLKMPSWLDPRAVAAWDRTTQALESNDLWTPLDVVPVTILSASFALVQRCVTELSGLQLATVYGDDGAAVEHPLSQTYREHLKLCQNIWMDYGMTPYSRVMFDHVDGEQQGKPKLSVYGVGAG